MQKRSHTLLAHTLLENGGGFRRRRFEWAFLVGSVEPDCNPLSYLKGSLRAQKFMGHNFSNSQRYIDRHILRLRRRARWTLWQYYTLGKLTHYLADAFTFPHNDTFTDSLMEHHNYETALREQFAQFVAEYPLSLDASQQDVCRAIDQLHRQYLAAKSDQRRDARFILEANCLLMASLLPQCA